MPFYDGGFMSLNFGTLNAALETNLPVMCEAVARGGKLDLEIGTVALGEIARWDAEAFPALFAAAKAQGRMIFKKSPVEINLPKSIKPHAVLSFLHSAQVEVSSMQELNAQVQAIYKRAIDEGVYFAGPYGDYITCELQKKSEATITAKITGLFQKAYPLMRAASDLVLTVEGIDALKKHKVYVISGIRAQEPGKGKAALFGGFRNVDGLSCESGLYAALREGKEEAGVNFSVPGIEGYKEVYDVQDVDAEASVLGSRYPAKVSYIGTIATSNLTMPAGGEVLPDLSKRVHFTSGYVGRIDMGSNLVHFNPLAFTAGDDIQKIKIVDITTLVEAQDASLGDALEGFESRLSFGIDHHNQIFAKAVKHIRAHGRIVQEPKALSCLDRIKQIFCCCRRR